MLVRCVLAFVLGVIVYGFGTVLTAYDGLISLIVIPLWGIILSLISVSLVSILGSPLLIRNVWVYWGKLWYLPTTAFAVSFILYYLSWLPANRDYFIDPEISIERPTFNYLLSIIGWFLMYFGVIWHPKIGFYGDKRWM